MAMKKKLMCAAVIAGLCVLLPAFLYARPSAEVTRSVYNFDPVPEGTYIEHSFVIKNTGDEPLEILKVNTG
ncbi:MAG: hypothetical protein R6V41_00990 [Desulfobacteraceae bacterium]